MQQPKLNSTPIPADELTEMIESMPLQDSDIVETLGLGGVMTLWRWKNGEYECKGPYAVALRNLEAIREFYGLTKQNQSSWSKAMPASEVKKRRLESKLYQDDVASMFGLSEKFGRQTLSRWENGSAECTGVFAFLMRSLKYLTKSPNVPSRDMSKTKANKMRVIEALSQSGNLNEAAEVLGVSRRTVNRYLNKYDLDKKEYGIP